MMRGVQSYLSSALFSTYLQKKVCSVKSVCMSMYVHVYLCVWGGGGGGGVNVIQGAVG